jgi:Domain of unknown function (DUF5664)
MSNQKVNTEIGGTTPVGLGERKNADKLRWRAFPLFLVRPLIQVAAAGEKKYGTYNFLKGQNVNTCLDSAMRHLDAYMDPTQPDIDAESGINHLGHAAWNCLVALYMQINRPELDDRYKPETEQK